MISDELKSQIDALSPEEEDKVYRYLWSNHVRNDVVAHAEFLGVVLSDEEIDIITERYVYDGDYDCNLSYWDNIENLINEERGIS